MKMSSAFPSRYLRAADLDGRKVRLRMSHVEMEDVAGTGPDSTKPVLYFKGKKKGLVLNVTNARTIASTYGDDMDAWEDRQIELYPTETEFQGKLVPCLRVGIPSSLPPQAGIGPPPPRGPEGEISLDAQLDV